MCSIEKRKPITPIKTLDVIFRRRYLPNTQFYFTNRLLDKKGESSSIKQRKPFRVPRSEKLLSYIKYSDRKSKMLAKEMYYKPVHKKDNIKIAETRNLSKRLYIDEPPDDVKAVVEIHPEFYNVIEGRPLRCFDDIKVYVNNIRNYAMHKQQIGYRNDLILKIDQSIIDEEKEYEAIRNNFKQHVKNFQKFLTEDYKIACEVVSKAEAVSVELANKDTELIGYITKITILNNILFKLDAIRSVLKTYRNYLIFVAPITWRQIYDDNLNNKVTSIQFDSGEFSTDNDLVDTLDINKMIEIAKVELKEPLQPHMYFTEPEQMNDIFRGMEIQSREYLIQLTHTHVPHRILKERTKQLVTATKQELDYFQFYINRIKDEIIREEYNEIQLQKMFYKLLNGEFYDSVASPETLKLKNCVEYVYEQFFGKCEEGHENIQDPMKILEVSFEEYNLKLDSLDFKIVNEARNNCFAQDLKMMKDAYKASRELKSFREMTEAMKKAFLPPAKYKRTDFKNFDDLKKAKAIKSITNLNNNSETVNKNDTDSLFELK